MQRRVVCRAIFLALCVLPTLAIAGWSVGRLVDNGARDQLRQVGQRLGLTIDCQATRTPRPGMVVLSAVEVREAESQQALARCDRLTLSCHNGRAILVGDCLRVSGEHLTASAAAIDRLTRSDWPDALQVAFAQVVLQEDSKDVSTWRQVQAKLTAVGGDAALGRELAIRDRQGGRLVVTRNRQIEPATTRVAIETGSQPLPWRLLADHTPATFGADPKFVGKVTLVRSEASAEGDLAGAFDAIDLPTLLSDRPGALALDAPATLRVDALAWRGERIEQAQLLVTAGAGDADPAWVVAANKHLGCGASDLLMQTYNAVMAAGDAAPRRIPFDELAVAVDLDASGLRLRGACLDASGQPMPCVLAAGRQPLLHHPQASLLPLLSAVRFLAPEATAVRPTGPLADAVARRLPLEEQAPTK